LLNVSPAAGEHNQHDLKRGIADPETIRKRVLDLLATAPALKDILCSSDTVPVKRQQLRRFLANMLTATFDDDPTIPPLEWVLTRDAIGVFRNILSARNERLAGYSFLQYVHDLIHNEDLREVETPAEGFFAELEHLVRGITGKAGVYSETVPVFLEHKGRKAAQLRSKDLSGMAQKAYAYLHKYPCGLDKDAVRRRAANAHRIRNYFKGTKEEWSNWLWQVQHVIRDADTLGSLITLTDEEYEAIRRACHYRIPFGITPYYASLMERDAGRTKDYAVRAQVIPTLHYVESLKGLKERADCSIDFMLEQDTSPIDGITRRYPMIVILKPILTCPQICVYCQRNWEIEDVYSKDAVLGKKKLEKALEWIEKTPEINEVLITGGDPLLLSDHRLKSLLRRVADIPHVERIRVGTRTPVTLPQRITDSIARTISQFHKPGKREVIIITHVEHPYEITPQAMEAVQKFRRRGLEVYNQLVYTFYNSRKFEAAALRLTLRLIGVTPYYTFNTKGKEETDEYRVPIARLLQEQKEDARLLPGTVRTDEIVFNVPRLGKNYLRAIQHHDVISILPDGRRVYEFHPWEKQLSLIDTYIYTDVSIYDYLQRLKRVGEDLSDYRTIWYYY